MSKDNEDSNATPEPEPAKKKRRLFTRRRVLKVGGGVVVAGALGTTGFCAYDWRQRFYRDPVRSVSDHRVKLPPTTPKMVIARGEDPAKNVRAVVERLGGIEPFVSRDDIVLIKPNIGWRSSPEKGANTHPEVVAELVRICRAARPERIIVSDCPVWIGSRGAFSRSGIQRAASDAGAEVVAPEDSRFLTVQISARLGTWDILEPFVVATKIINVPVVKHHSDTYISGGMKNWIGITNKRRIVFHNDLQASVAELAALMRPTLTVLDASRVLMRNGPQGGSNDDIKQVKTIAAGTDPVALDAWAFSQLEIPADKMPGYLQRGQAMGLGRVDYRSLQPIEIVTG